MFWVGTSGYQYKEWKGKFYPTDLPHSEMLDFYVRHFNSVEINYTFFRIPGQKTIDQWIATTPKQFKFSFKAPKQITHIKKLYDCEEVLTNFYRMAEQFGDKLGALLFQLPPYFKKDIEALRQFSAYLIGGVSTAFEFRHPSWFDEEVFDLLRQHGLALCIAHGEKLDAPLVKTAEDLYVRLRGVTYDNKEIQSWAKKLCDLSIPNQNTFVYFKHEEQATGPRLAQQLLLQLNR